MNFMGVDSDKILPEHTAVRVALWRALHLLIDEKPAVFSDEIGALLVGEEGWRQRGDMAADFSKPMRASIVGRARFIEDLVEEELQKGVLQYVILGAGLDTFAQRRPELASRMHVFEIDQPGPQAWKQQRLLEKGFSIPKGLHFVPVDFEQGQVWWEKLADVGFDITKPSVVVSTGVSMYLTKETNLATLKKIAEFASGSTFATTFMLALDLLAPQERAVMEFVMKKAQESGTPFLSLFSPEEFVDLATKAGFKKSEYVSAEDLYQRYFAKRSDGLRAGNAEAFLVAKT
jgi:methyltransferase (TIGR00027 family)